MLGKIVHSKLPDNLAEVDMADGVRSVRFVNHRAVVPNDVALRLTRTSDFYTVVRDEWREPLRQALIVRNGNIGDILLTTPLVRYLANKGIIVDYLTLPAYACLLEWNPYIRNVMTGDIATPFGLNSGEGLEDYRRDYDAVVDLRWYAERIEGASPQNCGHRVDTFFRAMEICDIPTDRSLDLLLTSEEQEWAPQNRSSHPTVAYVLSSTMANRNWTADQHRGMIDELREVGVDIIQITPDTGLTLRQTAAIIGACDAVITPDTGPFHMSQALRRPTFAYFGCFPANERATAPLHVINDVSVCDRFPCRDYSCHYAGTERENQCLRANPRTVVGEVLDVLRNTVRYAQ